MDGLGRLTSVCEVTSTSQLGAGGTPAACGQDISGTGFLTTYGYDTLGNLTSVSQNGLNSRTFQNDSLSRLTAAYNPESGSSGYGYDPNGNLISKTDARGITTTLAYDSLNRITAKTYSDSTPSVSFFYDLASTNGVSIQYPVGRLVRAAAGSCVQTINSYDKMGRVTTQWLNTPSYCGPASFIPSYGYDLAGNMTSSTNGAGVTFNYTVNRATRLTTMTSSLVDSNHPGTLFSGAHYNAAGSMLSASLGNVIAETRTYDPRLRLASIADGSNYSLTIPSSGGYAPNGDILAANDSVNGNWTYSYDDFNRIGSSNQNSGQSVYSYVYDRFGNRWQQNGPHSMQLSFSGANNRMDGYSYDAAGNLLSDGTHNYAYDAENRITTVDGGSTASYAYDANGQRVQKATSSGAVNYIYDLAGQQITEINSSGGWNRGEVYAGGRHVATYANSTTYFIHPDWLGTERARSNVSGGLCETTTSLPFGDWESNSGSCADASPMHFTGKERDSESGLDNFGARFDASSMGRFMSPDPGNIGVNRLYPQSWNAYSYSLNNPLNLTDPTGLYVCEDSEKCDSENDKAFAKSLADAQAAANKLTGDDRAAAQRAIDAYGAEGDDNGVNVRFDSNVTGAVTEVSGVANGNKSADLNPNGQNINVTFNPDDVRGDTAGAGVAHEGSHVADGSAWVASGFAANRNPTNFNTEFNAYHVEFNIQNALGVIKAPPGAHFLGGYIPFTNPLKWRAGDTFKKVTPDLKQRIKEDYKNLDSPAFHKGYVLEP